MTFIYIIYTIFFTTTQALFYTSTIKCAILLNLSTTVIIFYLLPETGKSVIKSILKSVQGTKGIGNGYNSPLDF